MNRSRIYQVRQYRIWVSMVPVKYPNLAVANFWVAHNKVGIDTAAFVAHLIASCNCTDCDSLLADINVDRLSYRDHISNSA
jgi:hypothetical protein